MLGGIRRYIKSHFPISEWMGVRFLKDSTHSISSIFKKVFIPAEPHRTETFEQAMARLHLTEKEIQERAENFKKLSKVFSIIAIIIYSYFLYLIWVRSTISALAALALCLIVLTQAFHYHFWSFQIKKRKLGCTFKEWWEEEVLGKKS